MSLFKQMTHRSSGEPFNSLTPKPVTWTNHQQVMEAIAALAQALTARDSQLDAIASLVAKQDQRFAVMVAGLNNTYAEIQPLKDICQQTQDEQVGFAGRLSAIEQRLEKWDSGYKERIKLDSEFIHAWLNKLESPWRELKQIGMYLAEQQAKQRRAKPAKRKRLKAGI